MENFSDPEKIQGEAVRPPDDVEAMRRELEESRREAEESKQRLADYETLGLREAKIPAPPRQIRDIPKDVATGIEGYVHGGGAHPAPAEIPFDPLRPDAGVQQAKDYADAAKLCDQISYMASGMSAVYHWRRGEWFTKVEAALAKKGKFVAWYKAHGWDDSSISRDRMLYKSYADVNSLQGISADAAHTRRLKERQREREARGIFPTTKKKKPEDGWLPFKERMAKEEANEPVVIEIPAVPKEEAAQAQAEAPAEAEQQAQGEAPALPAAEDFLSEVEKDRGEPLAADYLCWVGIEAIKTAWNRSTEGDAEVMSEAVAEMEKLVKKLKAEQKKPKQ